MTATQSIDQVRTRILDAASEIEEFSQLPMPRDRFFQRFARLAVEALSARGGAVWMRQDDHSLLLVADEGLSELAALEDDRFNAHNERLLSEVVSTGQARVVSTFDSEAGPAEAPYVIVIAPLHAADRCVGAVEVFQRSDSTLQARSGYLQFIEQMAGHASRFLSRGEAARTAADQGEQFWHDFSQLTLDLQNSLDVGKVAATAANDGRVVLNCDRVSVAWRRGRRTVIEAISGQDRVNPRANLVGALSKLAAQVIPAGETVVYDGHVENLPPQLETPLADYVAESNSRMIALIPLCEPVPLKSRAQDDRPANERDGERKPFGCLIVEQASEGEPQPGLIARAELVADQTAAALHNARRHQRIFLLPAWTFLGGCLEWLHGRKLLKTLAVLFGLAVVVAALLLVRWDYRVEGEGRLMPVVQREVFAPWDGEVVEIAVVSGQRVERGDPLLRLQNDQLHSELADVRNSLREKRQEREALDARISNAIGAGNIEERLRLRGEYVDTGIQINGLLEQEKILAQREAALTVRAPIAGVVATFQIEQLLDDRPVQRGELLLQVMDDKGKWRLELDVEEHRMGHLLQARSRSTDGQLPIEYVLATSAEETHTGRLTKVATRPIILPERGSVVRVFSSIDRTSMPHPRIGAEVRAKIECGRRSLGYVLFGDVIEFIRQRLWL